MTTDNDTEQPETDGTPADERMGDPTAGRTDDRGERTGGAAGEPERMRILEMLERGTITAAEASELLAALGDLPWPSGRRERRERWERRGVPRADAGGFGPPRRFRVRVTEAGTGRTRADVTIPIGMVGFGVGMAQRFRVKGADHLDDLLTFVRAGRFGTVFDVTSHDSGERVEIIVE